MADPHLLELLGVPRASPAREREEDDSPSRLTVYTEQADRLMLVVYAQLMRLCTDVRSEVRNSAVKTLHSTLLAHAKRMAPLTCVSCVRLLVLPLLRSLQQQAKGKGSSTGPSGTALGKDKGTGKDVMMMVHYSRDTAQKQWDETRVYALQGSAELMRVCLLRVSGGSGFEPLCVAYLKLVEKAMSQCSSEVALAAASALQDVVLFAGVSTLLLRQKGLWNMVLRTYCGSLTMILAQAGPGVIPSAGEEQRQLEKLATALLQGFKALLVHCPALVSAVDVVTILTCTRPYASRLRSDDGFPLPSHRETPSQRDCLELFSCLTPSSNTSWALLIDTLLFFVTYEHSRDALSSNERRPSLQSASVIGDSKEKKQLPLCAAFTMHGLKVLSAKFTQCPQGVCAEKVGAVMGALLHVMLLTSRSKFSAITLCEGAVQTFVEAVKVGFSALEQFEQPARSTASTWAILVDGLSVFLSPVSVASFVSEKMPEEMTTRWEDLEMQITSCVVDVLVPCSNLAGGAYQWKLLRLLDRCGPSSPSTTPLPSSLLLSHTPPVQGQISPGGPRIQTQTQTLNTASLPTQPHSADDLDNSRRRRSAGDSDEKRASIDGRLRRHAFGGLFSLSAGSALPTATRAVCLLTERVGKILLSLSATTPATEIEEACFLLQRLCQLRIHPQVSRALLLRTAPSSRGANPLEELSMSGRSKGDDSPSVDSEYHNNPRHRPDEVHGDNSNGSSNDNFENSSVTQSPRRKDIGEDMEEEIDDDDGGDGEGDERAGDVSARKGGDRGHLVKLFPELTACIGLPQVVLRLQIRQAFHLIGNELELYS